MMTGSRVQGWRRRACKRSVGSKGHELGLRDKSRLNKRFKGVLLGVSQAQCCGAAARFLVHALAPTGTLLL